MIIIGADHGGFELKDKIIDFFKKDKIDYIDVTDYAVDNKDDYPDVAEKISKEVLKNKKNFGIAICGTGIGISIACNKIKGIRSAVCYNLEVAKLAKEHNNCNIICFGGRQENNIDDIIDRIKVFTNSKYEGGRHDRRIGKIEILEEKFGDLK